MIPTRNLQIHAVHSCNLACQSCSHYSNQTYGGIVSLSEAETWIHHWYQRLHPESFTILGGEPTLHPQLPDFIQLVHRYWPNAELELYTNGFFLHRHPTLPDVLRSLTHFRLNISVHHDSPSYLEKVQPNLDLAHQWLDQYQIPLKIHYSHGKWTERYMGMGSTMEPFDDGDIRSSWEHCNARYCMQLFEGKLWKCGPLAYLKMQHERYQLSDQWQPYLKYQPLEPSCSDAELLEFVAREEESYCGMCPARPQHLKLPIPLRQGRSSTAA